MAKRLLLADDSITIQKVVNLTFADEGIEVISVGDGDAAIEAMAESLPDIVLADVHMPGLNGYQVCEAIRANPATTDLPVILLVGSFEPFDEDIARQSGATICLTKPFHSIRDLVSKVFDLLDAAEAKKASVVPVAVPVGYVAAAVNDDEPDDIHTLYQNSLSEQDKPEGAGYDSVSYDDSSFDDEMIETNYVTDEKEVERASFDGSRYAAESTTVEAIEESGQVDNESNGVDDAQSFVTTLPTFAPIHSPFDAHANEENVAVSEETSQVVSDFSPNYENEPYGYEHTAASSLSLVEDSETEAVNDLLDLPNVASGNTIEFTTKELAADAGGTTNLVSLSPELMEILVQKVVQKLVERQ